MADGKTVTDCRTRILELQTDLADAQRDHDTAVENEINLELNSLIEEFSRIVGMGGKKRKANDDGEKLRKSIQTAINRSIISIKSEHPELSSHLNNSLSPLLFKPPILKIIKE